MANYFTDRAVQYPGRVKLTPTGNENEYDLTRSEGIVTTPGTPFNASTFNDIAADVIDDTISILGDYVSVAGVIGDWTYRKWKGGRIEAWGSYEFAAKQGSAWAAGLYYSDETVSLPSGLFTEAPKKYITASGSQWNPYSAWGSSTTSMTIRFTKPNANSSAGGAYIYLVQD